MVSCPSQANVGSSGKQSMLTSRLYGATRPTRISLRAAIVADILVAIEQGVVVRSPTTRDIRKVESGVTI